jgi:hypothetical protein
MNAPRTMFTCGRCRDRGFHVLTRWHQIFVCGSCLDELDTPMSPVTRTLELDRALTDRLLPIAAERNMPVAVLARRLLDIISEEPVMIANLLEEEE